jgi:hypothetical protein
MSQYELQDGAGVSGMFDFSPSMVIRQMITIQIMTMVDFGDDMVVQFRVLTYQNDKRTLAHVIIFETLANISQGLLAL